MIRASTDRDGLLITYAYDNGTETGETGETWHNADSSISYVTFTYDPVGNLLTAANSYGAYSMSYDALDRMTLVSEPTGAVLTMAYDNLGNRTQVTDAVGVENSTYDARNRLINRGYSKGGTVVVHIQQEFDALDQLTTLNRYSSGTPGALVASTYYNYDDEGRITNLHHVSGGGTLIDNYNYTYDAAGNITAEDRNGTVTTYTYDATNQLLGDSHATFTYDATGNRNNGSYTPTTNNELHTDGIWTYTYDNDGNETGKSNATDVWSIPMTIRMSWSRRSII